MLTIICGEDIATARQNLLALKKEYEKKGYNIQQIPIDSIPDVYKNNRGVIDLFGQESVYFVDDVSSKYKGRGKTEFKDTIQEISKNKTIHVVDWEEGKSAYDLGSLKKLTSSFLEYKPSRNIFQLLDAAYPGNIKEFSHSLEIVSSTQDILFIYTLLWRHIRKLILAYEGLFDKTVQPWQKGKLMQQAKMWDKKKLLTFYEGLIKIDQGMKTNTSTFDMKESIEILSCYFLK